MSLRTTVWVHRFVAVETNVNNLVLKITCYRKICVGKIVVRNFGIFYYLQSVFWNAQIDLAIFVLQRHLLWWIGYTLQSYASLQNFFFSKWKWIGAVYFKNSAFLLFFNLFYQQIDSSRSITLYILTSRM